jgi:molybdate transport system regulatory protein
MRTTRRRPSRVQPKLKLWVVFGSQVKFGDGRARLLELVDELGSLRRAVARLGMSYRAAWGYFRELERASGVKLLERTSDTGPRAGTRLTPEGRALVTRFRRFQAGLETTARRRFARTFRAR